MKTIRFLLLFIVASSSGIVSNAQQLYVGANYHPHDVAPEQWRTDIEQMKAAGFTVVRMGHLAWDSYEPQESRFEFEWFDPVMDMMAEAGIGVILDIAVRPAPLWLHKKHPSINITNFEGDELYPNHRYMVDVGDPMYQQYALRFTEAMTRRYADHPALLAYGIDNEPAAGAISHSETVRQRFIAWLKDKYTVTDSLNRAWAGQRWSRRISDFDEVGIPSVSGGGAPERVLDFRRFLSDDINGFYFKMIDVINRNAPGVHTNTNAWYYATPKYYDYAPMAYSGKMTRGGAGFYPGYSLLSNEGIKRALFGIPFIQYESNEPFWCNEFTTMTAAPGAVRKQAYATLMYGNQMVCGWTWQTMHGGEEQYLQGMMDWDGQTNRQYDEYKQIAQEFKKIEQWFPYQVDADIALAFSFASQIAAQSHHQPSVVHENQLRTCFNMLYDRNMDVRVVDAGRSALDYKLLILPGHVVMDQATADNIRRFVQEGGTVVMTSRSATTEESGQIFSTTQPGYLHDVFGIRIGGFGETATMNELSRLGYKDDDIQVSYKGHDIRTTAARYDFTEPRGATVLGTITSLDKDYPIVTVNRYGQGQAIYVGVSAVPAVLAPIIDDLTAELSLRKGPDVPTGILARQIDENHMLLFNMTTEPIEVPINGSAKSILWERTYIGSFLIEPHEPDFIEWDK